MTYPGRTRQFGVRRERVAEVRRWLENYQRLKQAIAGICEFNHELLRPGPHRRRAGRQHDRDARAQVSFGDGLITEEVSDLCEGWTRYADRVLADEQIVAAVYDALARRPPRAAVAAGSARLPRWVSRLLLLKHIRNLSYGAMEREVRANLVYRDFTQIGGGKMPDANTHDAKVRARVRGVKARRVQVDEIWSFTAAKQKNVSTMKKPVDGAGDTWTWTAIEADTKLLITWLVGGRDSNYAIAFMDDLRDRLANRIQPTSDGHRAYLEAVEGAFAGDVDYAQLVKIYGATPEGAQVRYSPAQCIGAEKRRVESSPDPKHISTSYAERQNLTMRMQMRRFTRLTNAFSKKFENHMHMVALYTIWYNYVKQHKSLKGLSPAIAAGISAHALVCH